MNEKFTQGKWQANFDTGNIYGVEKGKDCTTIAMVNHLCPDEEYEANLRLFTHAKEVYFLLWKARLSADSHLRKDIEEVLREINPDFDKSPIFTDIKAFADYVKNVRLWQRIKENAIEEHHPNAEVLTEKSSVSEKMLDSVIEEILQEAQS